MYKLTIENIVDFTNWWLREKKYKSPSAKVPRKCTEEDVLEYFNLPKFLKES